MNRTAEVAAELQAALAIDPQTDGDRQLMAFLEARGFAFPDRSATNVRLLAYTFPPACLRTLILIALATPVPDSALNNLERLCAIVPRDELLTVCTSEGRLEQLLAICGSSPFLTGILCRDPLYFRELFLNRLIDVRRDEATTLSALRARISAETDYHSLLPLLRRFKYLEILRIAARELALDKEVVLPVLMEATGAVADGVRD